MRRLARLFAQIALSLGRRGWPSYPCFLTSLQAAATQNRMHIALGRNSVARFAHRFLAAAVLAVIAGTFVACEDAQTDRVELTLGALERPATRSGSKIAVLKDGEKLGELSDGSPTLSVPAANKLTFEYVGPNGEATDVTWSQTVPAGAHRLAVVQPWRRSTAGNADWHVLAWARPKDLKPLKRVPSEVTVLSPIWWSIDKDGQLRSNPDAVSAAALRQTYDVALWPAVQGLDADGLHIALNDDARRSETAARIAQEAKLRGAQGINIDLEGYRLDDSNAVIAFVQELAALVHAWGGVVSYDVVARSDSWEVSPAELAYWSNAPKRRELAAAVDYIILMAYDQFNHHRPTGPVAAPKWAEEVLAYLLRYADPQNVILGIPAYGLIWDPAAPSAPRAVSLSQLNALDGTASYDETHRLCRIELSDGRFYWAEKDISKTRTELAVKYDLAGVAIWRLGLDYPELWHAIRASKRDRGSVLGKLKEFFPTSLDAGLSACS